MIDFFRKSKKHITAGIEVSDDRVSILLLDIKDPNSPHIKKYVSYDVNDKNTLGDIANNLKQVISECGVKQIPCCYVLGEKDYELFQLESPNVPDNEIVEAMRWKVKDLIAYNIEDAVFDVFFQPANGGKKMLYAVVAKKDLIAKRYAIIDQCDLNLIAVDIPELSYRNYIEHTEYANKSVALVVIKSESGKLLVINNSEVCFTRTFPLSYSAGLFDDIPENDLILELQRSLDYYERQLKQDAPSIIIICGENVIEEKVTEGIKQSFHQKVTTDFLDLNELSEQDQLMSHIVMSTYGASLRKEMLL